MRRVLAVLALAVGATLLPVPALAAPVAAPAAAPVIPDLRTAGPYPVTVRTYDFGDSALTIPGFPSKVEVRGVVHAPTTAQGKKLPLVILLHGRHATCASGADATLRWPCPAHSTPIQSYRGYDYLAGNLASHGYVVVSISANGINAYDNQVDDYGMAARAALIVKHLALWKSWNTAGAAPFGTAFVGAINPGKVGLLGHSRGGEGVATFLAKAPVTGFKVTAALALAPTDFSRVRVVNVPLAVALPLCDGDVSDLQGVHYVDDNRYVRAGDSGSRLTVSFAGSNHNFFNTVWSPSSKLAGASDDISWIGGGSVCGATAPGRLTEAAQRLAGLAYVNGFFRYYLGLEPTLRPLWTGEAAAPAWVGADVKVSRHPADLSNFRRVINRLQAGWELTKNNLGGSVSSTGLVHPGLCSQVTRQGTVCLTMSRQANSYSEPHAGWDGASLPIFKAQWDKAGAALSNAVPAAAGDVSKFAAIQVRAAVDFSDTRNPVGVAQGFSFAITDAAGHHATVAAGPYTQALKFPAMSTLKDGDVAPHFLLQQVRVPLSAFAGVDLKTVRNVTILFNGRTTGSLGLSDLMMVN